MIPLLWTYMTGSLGDKMHYNALMGICATEVFEVCVHYPGDVS